MVNRDGELRVWGLRVWGLRDGGQDAALRAWEPRGAAQVSVRPVSVHRDAARDEELRVWELRVWELRDAARDAVPVCPAGEPVEVRDGEHPVSEQDDDPDRGAELLPLREAAG